MASSKRPSFLKRQKEQLRVAKAIEKRETRRARKQSETIAVDVEAMEPLSGPPEPDDAAF
jgi:hypothetical protein